MILSSFTSTIRNASTSRWRRQVLIQWSSQWRLWERIFYHLFKLILNRKLTLIILIRISFPHCKQWLRTLLSRIQMLEIQRHWCFLLQLWRKKGHNYSDFYKPSLSICVSPPSKWLWTTLFNTLNSEKASSSSFRISSNTAPRVFLTSIPAVSNAFWSLLSSQSNIKSQNWWRSDWRACGTWMTTLLQTSMCALNSMLSSLPPSSRKSYWSWQTVDIFQGSSFRDRFSSSWLNLRKTSRSKLQFRTLMDSPIVTQLTNSSSRSCWCRWLSNNSPIWIHH